MTRAALALAAVLALVGCGDDRIEPVPIRDGGAEVASAPGLQVRPVLGPAEPGDGTACDGSGDPELPGNAPADEEAVLCDLEGTALRLGPAAVVGGVDQARVSELTGVPGSRAITLRLEQQAAEDLGDLTGSAGSSDSRVAVVLDGIVLASPTVAGAIGGRLLVVTGEFSEEQAERYADALAP